MRWAWLDGTRSAVGLRRRKGERVVVGSAQAQEHSKGWRTGQIMERLDTMGARLSSRRMCGSRGVRNGTKEMTRLRRPRALGMDGRTHLEGERLKGW